jgi:hypothetical protein
VFFGIIVFSYDCSIKRNIVQQNTSQALSDNDLVKAVLNKNLSAKSFYIRKANINYSDSLTDIDFLISIKHNEEDKYLAVIRTLSGIELYRVLIAGDSLCVNDRLNRAYIIGNENYLKKISGYNFETLVYFFGDLFYSDKMIAASDGCISGEKQFYGFWEKQKIEIAINCNVKKVSDVKLTYLKNSSIIEIVYDKFKNKDFITFPEEMVIRNGERRIVVSIDINDIDTPWTGSIEFVPGKNYKRQELK